MRTVLLLIAASVLFSARLPAQSDLDDFMQRVLARRDDNWKKLQQYVLDEEETVRITGPGDALLIGSRREYYWFPREGFFIRSPVKVDGVTIGDEDRRRAEEQWLERERKREKRCADCGERASPVPAPDDPSKVEDVINQSFEPQFISSANFLRFKFDPGRYALAGREQLLGRDVLRIEYYPTKLFSEGRSRPNRRLREREQDIQRKMNKVSFVTLWVEPKEHQILQYEFNNVGLEFLPARWLVRVDGMQAAMRLAQPFPGVWLPESITIGFNMTLAVGEVTGRYEARYHNYREAATSGRVR